MSDVVSSEHTQFYEESSRLLLPIVLWKYFKIAVSESLDHGYRREFRDATLNLPVEVDFWGHVGDIKVIDDYDHVTMDNKFITVTTSRRVVLDNTAAITVHAKISPEKQNHVGCNIKYVIGEITMSGKLRITNLDV